MVRGHQASGAAVCTASRTIHRADGSLLFIDKECDGKHHVDTSCFFLTSAAFRVLPVWAMMPRQLGALCDQFIWQVIGSLGFSTKHHAEPTVAFRTQYEAHYRLAGEAPPAGVKTNEQTTEKAMRWWNELPPDVRDEWLRRIGLMQK